MGNLRIWYNNKYYRRRILRLQRRILDTLSLPQVHTSSRRPSNPPRSSHEGRWSGFSVAMNLRTSFTVTNPERTPCSSTRIVRGLFPAMSGPEIQGYKADSPHALEYLHDDFQWQLRRHSHRSLAHFRTKIYDKQNLVPYLPKAKSWYLHQPWSARNIPQVHRPHELKEQDQYHQVLDTWLWTGKGYSPIFLGFCGHVLQKEVNRVIWRQKLSAAYQVRILSHCDRYIQPKSTNHLRIRSGNLWNSWKKDVILMYNNRWDTRAALLHKQRKTYRHPWHAYPFLKG